MKHLVLILSFVLLYSTLAFSKDVIITVPDSGVSFDALNENFDGSISILKPTVWASGKYLPIAQTNVYGYSNSDDYTCLLFGFSPEASATTTRIAAQSEETARLRYTKEKGLFFGGILTNMSGLRVLNEVTCAKK